MPDAKPDNEQPTVTVAEPKRKASIRPKTQKLPPYNVVLLDDDEHSYDYVIKMLGVVFTYEAEKAYGMAKEVDTKGRVIVLTTHKELAELKRDQILAFGADPSDAKSTGSMRAVVEPAEG